MEWQAIWELEERLRVRAHLSVRGVCYCERLFRSRFRMQTVLTLPVGCAMRVAAELLSLVFG